MNILQAMEHKDLFRPWFKDPATWVAWRSFLSALFALPMTPEQLAIYRSCTGRETPPETPFNEAWLVCGRRGGKSFVLALIGVFLATFRDYREFLQPGERATIMVLAADRRQARAIFRFVYGLLHEVPALKQRVERTTQLELHLTRQVSLEIHSSSYRSVRGYSLAAALCDEVSFWWSEESAANPDHEVIGALKPALASIPGSMFLAASSPYAKRGTLYDAYREHFGKDDAPALVWRGATQRMNPLIPQSVIDKAYADDPAKAEAEFGAQFRSDIESYVSREAVEACVVHGQQEIPPSSGIRYSAFVDPCGGSKDAFTMAICHNERDGDRDIRVLDCVRSYAPPFSPEQVVSELCGTLKNYNVSVVSGDKYAGLWPREQFEKRGVRYKVADRVRSDLYRDFLPMINSQRVRLLDNEQLVKQLVNLERRTGRSGKDTIDHPQGGHDDLANAVAGALVTRMSSGVAIASVW